MDLRLLQAFVAVAEEQSFTRAAARLYLAQPALSRQIKALERHLGSALFERTSRRVELTEAGVALLDDARRLLQAEDRLRATAAQWRMGSQAAARTLRVALFCNGLDALTRPVHEAFTRAHPSVQLHARGHVGYDDHLQAVARREVDVFVVRPPYEPVPDVELVPLFTEPAVAVLRGDDPRAVAPALSPEALLDDLWPVIPHAPQAWTSYWALDGHRNGEVRRFSRTTVLAHGEDLAMVEHGEGLTVTALSRTRRDLYDPLVAVPVTGTSSTVALAVHAHHDQAVADYVTIAQQATRDLIALVPGAALPA